MDEPRRWLDPRSDASAELRALLDAGAPPPPLPPAVRAAGAKHVAGLARAAAAAPVATFGTKAVAFLCAVGTAALLGAAGLRATRRPAARSAVSAARIAPSPPSTGVPVVTRVVTPVVSPVVTRVVTPAVSPSLPAPRGRASLSGAGRGVAPRPRARGEVITTAVRAPTEPPAPSDESRIEAARAGLATAPAESLALAQSTPADGPFAEERAWLTLRALDRLGRRAEVRAAADAFLARWPESLYAPAVRARFREER